MKNEKLLSVISYTNQMHNAKQKPNKTPLTLTRIAMIQKKPDNNKGW